MASLNRIMIIGNVGRDPEMRYSASGVPTTKFSVAVNHRRNGPDGQPIDETEWFNVVTFRQLAERCNEMVTKGAQIYVDGRLQSREWEGQDGQKRRSLDILANTVVFLTNRGRGAAPDGDEFGDFSAPTPLRPQPSRAASAQSPANAGFGDDGDLPPDDLPF